MVFGTENTFVGMWNIETGDYVFPQTWTAHSSSVNCIKILSATSLVSGSSDWKLYVWDISATPNITATFTQHAGSVTGVDKLPSGNLVSISEDKSVRIWNPTTTAAVYTKTTAHTVIISCVRVLADGRIATGDVSKNIKIWSTDLSSSTTLPSGHTSAVNVLELLSNDQLVSGSDDGYAIVWNMTTLINVNKFLAVGGSSVSCAKQLSDGAITFAGASPNIYTYKLTGTMTQNLVHTGNNFLLGEYPCQDTVLLNSTHLAMAGNRTNTKVINAASSSNLFLIKNLSLSLSRTLCLENSGNHINSL